MKINASTAHTANNLKIALIYTFSFYCPSISSRVYLQVSNPITAATLFLFYEIFTSLKPSELLNNLKWGPEWSGFYGQFCWQTTWIFGLNLHDGTPVSGRVEYRAHLDPWGWRSVLPLTVTDDWDFQSSSVLLDGIFKEPCGRILCKSGSPGVVRLALLH